MLSREEMRIFDVNRNRITEAFRVVEDILRFSKGTSRFSKRIKKMRHEAFEIFENLERATNTRFIFHRDSLNDRGRGKDYDAVKDKEISSLPVIIRRNIRRVCEGARVCEEIASHTGEREVSLAFKSLRFSAYDAEKDLEKFFSARGKSGSKKK